MRSDTDGVAMALGPFAAIVIAAVLSPVRSDVGSANVALVLAIVVVLAAMAGRIAGFGTALAAAMSYNFFHTEPYESLRIHAARDVVTVVLLLVLGVVVSEESAWRRRVQGRARDREAADRQLRHVAERLASGTSADELWPDVRAALVEVLSLADCSLDDVPAAVRLPRSGSLLASEMEWSAEGFKLPAAGVSVTVEYQGRILGHVRMTPSPGRGTSLPARKAAVALVDLYAVSLARTPTPHTE